MVKEALTVRANWALCVHTHLTLVLTLQGVGGLFSLTVWAQKPLFIPRPGRKTQGSGHAFLLSPQKSRIRSERSQIIFPLFPLNPPLFRVPHSPAGPCLLQGPPLRPSPYFPAWLLFPAWCPGSQAQWLGAAARSQRPVGRATLVCPRGWEVQHCSPTPSRGLGWHWVRYLGGVLIEEGTLAFQECLEGVHSQTTVSLNPPLEGAQ